jgi:hypothetical protein
MSHVIDEKGVRHSHCHGVPADVWFKMIGQTLIALSYADRREQLGLIRTLETIELCDDPDCKRLNRRSPRESNVIASYRIIRDLEPVRPADPTNEKERKICEGHPWRAGSNLCWACTRVAMTKRLIDAQRAAKQ